MKEVFDQGVQGEMDCAVCVCLGGNIRINLVVMA